MASASARGNSRIGKLTRFLQEPAPPSATKMTLSFSLEEQPEVLHVWTCEQVRQDALSIAKRVDQECDDLADEISHGVTGHLAWCDGGGTRLAAKPLRVLPLDPMRQEFTGTNLDQARQAQRHLEAMTRLFVGSIQTVFDAQARVMSALVGRLSETEKRERKASQREQEALAFAEEVQAQMEEVRAVAEQSQPEGREERLLTLLQPAIAAFVGRQFADVAPANAPAAPAKPAAAPKAPAKAKGE